jgi:prolyl-tRNA editing enzyme YbaK/EbsC (Cys-tRNA(Pro) deacylase)
MTKSNASAARVQEALKRLGFELQVLDLPQSARTSAEAAQACACQVGQIAKSLVFKGRESQRPILAIASGANRVDESKLAALAGEPIEKPNADYVRDRTGFVIGGVAPVGLAQPMDIVIDEDLLQYEHIWAAAGAPNAVFRLTPDDLVKMTAGRVAPLKQE